MTTMDFNGHCAEIVRQTALLTGHIAGADLTLPVPTCPGWNVSQLVSHVDAGQRWAAETVASRATEPLPDLELRDLSGRAAEDPVRMTVSLTEATAQLALALRQAGPDAQMWCPVGGGGAAFYARRFAHEAAIHRADAALALGAAFRLDAGFAVDGVEEWLELGCLPFHFDVHPAMRELLGPDRTIGLRATDVGVDWLLDFTGDVITWRRSDATATAAVSAPVTDLLLLLYRRRPRQAEVSVTGDAGLVDFWLERVAFR